MADDGQTLNVFLDLLPNQPKNDITRENFRGILRQRFERTLPDAVERVWKLPPIIIKEPFGHYMELLLEARALFLSGHFYSCVAMCGIVGERLVKDVLRAAVLVEKEGKPERPADKAFDQLERAEVGGMVRFLKEAGLLSDAAGKAADDLGQLRNAYAHARGRAPEDDAVKAVTLLHTVVEDTVSVFKHFDVKDGKFVRKSGGP